MRTTIALILLCVALPALGDCLAVTRGAQLHFTWNAPTTRSDGKPLALSELSRYSLYWTCDTSGEGKVDSIAATLTALNLPATMLGQCFFAMSAWDAKSNESALSPPVCVLIKLPPPSRGGFR